MADKFMAHAPHHFPLSHLRARPSLATTQAAVIEQGPQRAEGMLRPALAQPKFTAFAPLGVFVGLSQARRLLGLSFGIGPFMCSFLRQPQPPQWAEPSAGRGGQRQGRWQAAAAVPTAAGTMTPGREPGGAGTNTPAGPVGRGPGNTPGAALTTTMFSAIASVTNTTPAAASQRQPGGQALLHDGSLVLAAGLAKT